jgi:hypothetical protein
MNMPLIPVKVPTVGSWIEGATGPEQVTRVDTYGGDEGAWVTTVDRIGRVWSRTRSHEGWWAPCPAPTTPTPEEG